MAWKGRYTDLACIVGTMLATAVSTSCRREADAARLFRRSRPALVKIYYPESRDAEDNVVGWRPAVGCFVSPKGTVLTSAHQIRTTSVATLVYETESSSSRAVYANTSRVDRQLDLALLEPLQPLSPVTFLRLDLGKGPVCGQRVAVLTLIQRKDRSGREFEDFPGLLDASVMTVFSDGLFASDIYAFTGLSGSPAIDLRTGRVLGVCVRRNRSVENLEGADRVFTLEDGTTISAPVPYLVVNYAVVRSVFSARHLLDGLQ